MNDKNYSILIVDDEELNRKMLAAYLHDSDFSTLEASNGMEAISILEDSNRSDIGAILLDKNMPGLDGFEVLRKLKAMDAIRDIPVILQTAANRDEDLVEGIRLGAYYYLTKPYNPSVIVSIVTAAVNVQIYHSDLREKLSHSGSCLRFLNLGSFEIRNLNEASVIAAELATACRDPDAAVLGIGELLINAIEHGNLQIGYESKTALLKTGIWEQEVLRLLQLPENMDKSVSVEFKRNDSYLEIAIEDQGKGFDWKTYLNFDPDRAGDSHGRGIAMANCMSFSALKYSDLGNKVVGLIDL